MTDEPEEEESTLRSVGERLGGWARRVGEFVGEVSGRPAVPEPLREPLATARRARLSGAVARAQEDLRALAAENPEEPFVHYGLGMSLVHDALAGGRPVRALREAADGVGDALGTGPPRLLRGAARLVDGDPEGALDELRRAASELGRLPDDDELEANYVLHLMRGLAQLRLGNEERALRELQKARARTPEAAGASLRALVLQRAVTLSLAAGSVADAELWARDVLSADDEHQLGRELLCRVLAAKGDRIGAHALLEELGPDTDRALDGTRLWVALTVGPLEGGEPAPVIALRYLQSDAEDPEHRRAWALAELDRLRLDPDLVIQAGLEAEIATALVAATKAAPRATRDRYLQELAHTALRLDLTTGPAIDAVAARLGDDAATAPEELRLLHVRHRLGQGDACDAEFLPGPPPRFRADPDVGGPWGPDPLSPVRSPDLRTAVLASQRHLAAAERCLQKRDAEAAQELLVSALVEWPSLSRARALLGELAQPDLAARLEDRLTRATSLLAGVPNRVLGISLEGIQDAMALVVAARERLARPLTIAIMGEFSAGKSTFVNALLGEAVAPMGVLPTTTTINVFRRGTGGGARVHYREGRIAMLDAADIQPFLHGLDTTEASRIRHVEIERSGPRMGDASVVDTPGLNALDPYHERVAREFLDEADAVVWVFSATRSGAATEASMLSELRDSGRHVLGVLNKVDTLDDAERKELAEYLREQLGEVLVEVVPLCGNEALEFRTQGGKGTDPFAAVERALESHFLERARELKRSLTARRLDEALADARTCAAAAIEALEQRATVRADAERTPAPMLLLRFADALREGLLAVDDALVRESLGIAVLQTGEGIAKGPLDPLDAEYLSAVFRDAALAALQRALLVVAREDGTAAEVLDRTFVPWASGHIDGLVAAEFVETALETHGNKIAEGERAMKTALRASLIPVAAAWAEQAKRLVHAVEQARNRADRHATSAPRAEALRLRAGVVAAIDALRKANEEEPT